MVSEFAHNGKVVNEMTFCLIPMESTCFVHRIALIFAFEWGMLISLKRFLTRVRNCWNMWDRCRILREDVSPEDAIMYFKPAPVKPASALIGVTVDIADFGFFSDYEKRKLIIQGSNDQYCSLHTVEDWFHKLQEPKKLIVIDEATHFLAAS